MPARIRRTAVPAEPVVETTAEETETSSAKRGPGPLAEAHVKWIAAEYGVNMDAQALYLAQTTRKEFRASAEYQDALEAVEAEREDAAAAREEAAAKRAEAKAAKEAAAVTTEETPAPARRGRKAAAAPAATEETTEEAPKPARRARAAKAAPATEAPAETTAAPAKRTRAKAPF